MQSAGVQRTKNRTRDVAAGRDETADALGRLGGEAAESFGQPRADLEIDGSAEGGHQHYVAPRGQGPAHFRASLLPSFASCSTEKKIVDLEHQSRHAILGAKK